MEMMTKEEWAKRYVARAVELGAPVEFVHSRAAVTLAHLPLDVTPEATAEQHHSILETAKERNSL